MADSGICYFCKAVEIMSNKLVEMQCGIHELCERCFNEGINCCALSNI